MQHFTTGGPYNLTIDAVVLFLISEMYLCLFLEEQHHDFDVDGIRS